MRCLRWEEGGYFCSLTTDCYVSVRRRRCNLARPIADEVSCKPGRRTKKVDRKMECHLLAFVCLSSFSCFQTQHGARCKATALVHDVRNETLLKAPYKGNEKLSQPQRGLKLCVPVNVWSFLCPAVIRFNSLGRVSYDPSAYLFFLSFFFFLLTATLSSLVDAVRQKFPLDARSRAERG